MPDNNIAHITTVHSRHDTRIRYKEVSTLANNFTGKIVLFVYDGMGDEISTDGFEIRDIGQKPRSRIQRAMLGNFKVYRKLITFKPSIIHFHDPELIPVCMLFALRGINVIYDIHEDVPKQILVKDYIRPKALKTLLGKMINTVERYVIKRHFYAVTSTEGIRERFPKNRSVVVRNFPLSTLFSRQPDIEKLKEVFIISYAGSLSEPRGIKDLVNAMELLPVGFQLQLLGSWQSSSLCAECKLLPGWSKTEYFGRVPHSEVVNYIKKAHIGVQMMHDVPNYSGGLATKIFEYLALGIPTIMSDTSERRKRYGDFTCYAEPASPSAIAAAILDIHERYEEVSCQFINNIPEIIQNYTWNTEARILVDLYKRIFSKHRKQGE
jgi:glycosyltransferase involved in cell wall biosynthesis